VSAKETAVYAMFGGDGEWLYVGSSVDPHRRRRSHARFPWYGDVRRFEVLAWFPSRREAMAHEYRLVREHRPLFCVHGNPDRRGEVGSFSRRPVDAGLSTVSD
jgi:predicted GIY-YIG superfamily endonuclease